MRRLFILFIVGIFAVPLATFAAVQTVTVAPGDQLDAHCETEFVNVAHDHGALSAECATPTPEPTPTPTPEATLEEPVSGETCPTWVHDRYVAEGPDGNLYPTWHPQIDAEHGCYFHHEHGSDPAMFADGTFQPSFAYVNAAVGHTENHEGFKTHIWTNGGYDWMFIIHQGSSGHGRACIRYHSVNLVVADDVTNEIVANLHALGDFGEAKTNRSDIKFPLSSCEHIHNIGGYELNEDGLIDFSTDGERQIPSMEDDNIGYEPWVLGDDALIPVLGFYGGDINVNVSSSVTACETNACARVVPVNDWNHRHGALRHFNYRVDSKKRFGVVDRHGTGQFTTNLFGTELGGPVVQYVKPGLSAFAASGGRHYPDDPYSVFYKRYDQLPFYRSELNHDGALRMPQ